MRWHTVDYLERDTGRRAGRILDRGFWLNDVPRLIPLCRLLGHRPVVDGTEPLRPQHGGGSRWVCCDRCGIRPNPQGHLDPAQWNIGQPYTGPWIPALPTDQPARRQAVLALKDAAHYPPGPWPANPTGTIGGQLIIGKAYSTSLEVKLGNCGSEQVLAANASIAPLGALYLHTENHGTWLQRRLNPTGYQSRVTGFSAHEGHLWWKLWARRDETSCDDPWWQHGDFRTNLVDIVLGPKLCSWQDIGEPVTATLHMPHGDPHEVTMRLRQQTWSRARRQHVEQNWSVDIRTRPGIPTKPGDHGHVLGFGVSISDTERNADWVAAALAHAAVQMTQARARYGYKPASEVNA
jgi:hypothetical protein